MEMSCHGSRPISQSGPVCHRVLVAGVFLALATVARGDPTNAQDLTKAQTAADAQCMVIGARLSASSDPKEKMPGQMILMYYLGRIDGRTPDADLKELLTSETQNMSASDVKSAASRCGKEFSARGDAIVQIGKTLSQPAR